MAMTTVADVIRNRTSHFATPFRLARWYLDSFVARQVYGSVALVMHVEEGRLVSALA